MRGSAIERSQNRQRKLDGIVTWYFDPVMESLPVMLQAALLLLGSALSRYLWGIDTTIASVVLGITSFGVIFYLFILIAGVATESCPYQTPGSHFLRYLGPKIWNTLAPITPSLGNSFRKTIETITFGWFHHTPPTIEQQSALQTALLDLRCIIWTLQTSLDTVVWTSAMIHLISALELAGFDPILVVECFNIFIGCINVSNQRVVITQGLDQLATVSAGCLGRIFHRLSIADQTSSVLLDIRRRYNRILPPSTDITALQSHHAMTMSHEIITGQLNHCRTVQENDRPSDHEHILIAQVIAEVAETKYQQPQKLPDWILHFALNSLSLCPLPQTSAVVDCLKIIAIYLGCDVSNITAPDKRYICLSLINVCLLTKN